MPNLSAEGQKNATFEAKNTNPHALIPKPAILSQKKQEFEFQETNSQKLGCIVFSLAAVSLEVSGEPCNSSI